MAARKSPKPKALWQVIERPDLKKAFVPTNSVTIGGEVIVTSWRFSDPENRELCAYCASHIGGARLCVIGGYNGVVDMPPSLAHRVCGFKWLAVGQKAMMQRNSCTQGPDLGYAAMMADKAMNRECASAQQEAA